MNLVARKVNHVKQSSQADLVVGFEARDGDLVGPPLLFLPHKLADRLPLATSAVVPEQLTVLGRDVPFIARGDADLQQAIDGAWRDIDGSSCDIVVDHHGQCMRHKHHHQGLLDTEGLCELEFTPRCSLNQPIHVCQDQVGS